MKMLKMLIINKTMKFKNKFKNKFKKKFKKFKNKFKKKNMIMNNMNKSYLIQFKKKLKTIILIMK